MILIKFFGMKQLIIFLLLAAAPLMRSQDTTRIFRDSLLVPNDSLLINRQDTTSADTVKALLEGEAIAAEVDTLVPLFQDPLSFNSTFITRREIEKTDYRYTGNLFKLFPLSFLSDHGLAGYPDDLFLYGISNYGTAYLKDGIFDNHRMSWYLDLNTVQSEYVDSIEIVRAPRAFLFGPYNRAAAVNFITKDEISVIPYSRIKYIEGPDGEAMIDGIFNSVIFKKFVLGIDITNRKKDISYKNSESSLWHITAKLKYIWSNSVNLTGSYEHVNQSYGINGGVNPADIPASRDLRAALYEYTAPVNFLFRTGENEQHNFKLRLFGRLFNNFNSDFNVYHKINLSEVSDNEFSHYRLYKSEVTGASLTQKILVAFAELKVNGNYEHSLLRYNAADTTLVSSSIFKFNNYSLAGIASAYFADSLITPSFFYKINGEKELNGGNTSVAHGSGFDVTFNLNNNLKLYFGYSIFETAFASGNSANTEAGAEVSFDRVYLKLNLFTRKDIQIASRIPNQPAYSFGSLNGAGMVFNFSLWKFGLQTYSSYYYNKENNYHLFPQINFTGGIYYFDKLFNDNLELKTGFTFYYSGKKDAFGNIPAVSAANRLDFMLAGEIQESAIAYFTFENIYDTQYYLIPYYPMPSRSIRFGVAWEILN